ncbi:DUF6152 family protein [Hydrogenophaga sp.]|uniref:DUF6152 family protein n=1 Tax=Hydrogenophaga sp. TaxID=1904254 RepID=UPI0035B3BCA6
MFLIRQLVQAAAVAALTLGTVAVHAHHSPAAWEITKRNSVTGVVKDASFRNPHGQITLAVTNEQGQTEEWRVETSAANLLRRRGWDFSKVTPGLKIRVVGHLNKEQPREIYIREIHFEDGTVFGDKGGNDAALD